MSTKTIKDIQQPKQDRGAKYDLLKIFERFESVTDEDVFCGTSANIRDLFQQYVWNCEGPAHYKTEYGAKNQKSFLDLVSAPMLLARLVASGCIPIIDGQNGYKVTWRVALKHKETGYVMTFYDYKGAASYGSHCDGLENTAFIKDALTLIKTVINPHFPHPYDGCVVGEIA